eukprot:CAMPEP_0171273410 /NCGR_PEP_ID=MMETSP0790-20130122/62272_1 /TAXON_ID=2925 /ORGANISM="Alexandrium catenella, Strain OF101" /LENGTH=595 /DNA_ID=CAMNT_0011742401 /DNA_START=18 /DNA_END=1807 /DNA_ORIENTATION=-
MPNMSAVPMRQMPHYPVTLMGHQPKPGPPLRGDADGAQPKMDIAEVTAAIETLYADQLKPYGRILRKRLNERAAAAGHRSTDVDIKLLRASCNACSWICIQEEDGGDWSALLQGCPATFVDVYSPHDLYPAELWRAAAAYFEGLDDASMVLPGGRYSCAQVLAARGLQFLVGRSLGEVCHIVQLAISQKKLLGYLNGAVVPYKRSQSMVKERCAERQRPCTSAAQGKGALATWEMVRACLQEILCALAPGVNSIPLSNVKRLFRSRFHTELSETALGHAKLSELLQDPRLRDVCSVRLQGATGNSKPAGGSLRERAKWVKPLCLEEEIVAPEPSHGVGDSLQHSAGGTGITPSPDFPQGGQVLPRLLGRSGGPPGAGGKRGLAAAKAVGQAPVTCNGTMAVEPGMYMPAPAMMPSQGCQRSPQMKEDTLYPVAPTSEEVPCPVLTPSTLGIMGFSVQNTFIHAAMPPPTPPAGASGRAHSLPRDMGSHREAWAVQTPTPNSRARSGSGECGGLLRADDHAAIPAEQFMQQPVQGVGEPGMVYLSDFSPADHRGLGGGSSFSISSTTEGTGSDTSDSGGLAATWGGLVCLFSCAFE